MLHGLCEISLLLSIFFFLKKLIGMIQITVSIPYRIDFFFFFLNWMREKDYRRWSFPFPIQIEERIGNPVGMLLKIRWKNTHLVKAYARKLTHQLFLLEELLMLFHPPHLPDPITLPQPPFGFSFPFFLVFTILLFGVSTSLSSTQVTRPSSTIFGHFFAHWRSPLQHTAAVTTCGA